MFGRHYARILSRMENSAIPGPKAIHRLILTRTSRERARKTAATLGKDSRCRVPVIGEAVHNEAALVVVLEKHTPDLTCIVAKDPTLGNRIHAGCSLQALAAGSRVLCEKPFSEADGNGASLIEANLLAPYAATGAFGLELPFAAIRKHMQEKLQWDGFFRDVAKIEFFWGTQTAIRTNLFNELALHPWSLIPRLLKTERIQTETTPTVAVAAGRLQHGALNRTAEFRITLSNETRFRGFRADNRCFGFRTVGTAVQLIQLDVSIEAASPMDPQRWPGEVLLEVDNPLRRNIIASILGEPITGVRRTIQSQLFLEMIHGYRP